MAVDFPLTTTDYLKITANLPGTGDLTVMAWLIFDTKGGSFNAWATVSNGVDDEWFVGHHNSGSGGSWRLYGAEAGNTGGSDLSTGVWYHVAYTRIGTTHTVYVNGVSDISHVGAAIGDHRTEMRISSDVNTANENMDGRVAAMKIWETGLTQNEVLNEMRSQVPQRTANLYGFWPMLSHTDLKDYSGNGHDWTTVGTLTTLDNPPASWRQGRPRLFLPAAAVSDPFPVGYGLVRQVQANPIYRM